MKIEDHIELMIEDQLELKNEDLRNSIIIFGGIF